VAKSALPVKYSVERKESLKARVWVALKAEEWDSLQNTMVRELE